MLLYCQNSHKFYRKYAISVHRPDKKGKSTQGSILDSLIDSSNKTIISKGRKDGKTCSLIRIITKKSKLNCLLEKGTSTFWKTYFLPPWKTVRGVSTEV